MVKRFCSVCGKEFDAATNRQCVCPTCKETRQAENQKAQAIKAVHDRKEKGIVNAFMYKTDREFVKAMAKESGVTFTDKLHEIIESMKGDK